MGKKITDKMMLDWLENQGQVNTPWVARKSGMGRGYRLHQDAGMVQNVDGFGETPREAIAAAIHAERRAKKGE